MKHWPRAIGGLLTAMVLIPVPVFAAVSFTGGWRIDRSAEPHPDITFAFQSANQGTDNQLVFTVKPGVDINQAESIRVTSVAVPTGTFPTIPVLANIQGLPLTIRVTIEDRADSYMQTASIPRQFIVNQFSFPKFPNPQGTTPTGRVTVIFTVQGQVPTSLSPFTVTFP
jgi:hypothetical protein